MKSTKNIIVILSLFFFSASSLNADVPYYIDFKYILNSSVAGKKAQDTLKKKLQDGIGSLEKKEKSIQEDEKN